MSRPLQIRADTVILTVLLAVTTLFSFEVFRFVADGVWVIHGGARGFSRWPQPSRNNLNLLAHSVGMFAWIAAVVYQLRSKGKGAHVMVGRASGALVMVALAFSFPPALASAVPALHAIAGLSLMDVTLLANVVGISVETGLGVYKARVRRVVEHRKHLLTAVLFTAAPGIYRALVMPLSCIAAPHANEAQGVLASVWAHELAACLAILISLLAMLSRPLSGHREVLGPKFRAKAAAWETWLARSMLGVAVALVALYLVWTADLIALRVGGTVVRTFARDHAPWWIAYF